MTEDEYKSITWKGVGMVHEWQQVSPLSCLRAIDLLIDNLDTEKVKHDGTTLHDPLFSERDCLTVEEVARIRKALFQLMIGWDEKYDFYT